MRIYDQYEVEPNIGYSGSMTSEYIVGRSTLSSSIVVSRSIYNTNRLVVGDKTTGITGSIFTTIPKWRYHDFINFVSGTIVRGSNRFAFCSNNDIIYFDSTMPNMARVADLSGDFANFCLLSYLGNTDVNADAISHADAVDIYISASSPWPVSFPFQSKYKQITRQISQGRQLGYATGSLSGSILGGLHFVSVASATLPTWYNSYWFETVCNSSPLTSFSNGNVRQSISGNLVSNNAFTAINFDLIKKVYFGSGDGTELTVSSSRIALPNFRRMPQFDVYLFTTASNSNTIYLMANPRLRGFKYGVFNANPTNPKHVFRRSSFGQFRDMLEMAPQPALITPDNRTLTFPVTVTFTSGTALYASSSLDFVATGSTTFNPRDNGQYDIHARVGQPYFDIDAID